MKKLLGIFTLVFVLNLFPILGGGISLSNQVGFLQGYVIGWIINILLTIIMVIIFSIIVALRGKDAFDGY